MYELIGKINRRILWPIATALLLAAALPANAAVIFDNCVASGCTAFSDRPAENSPGALLSVSANVTINQIAVKNDLDTSGNLRFLIFDHASHLLLFASAPKFFADDGISYKVSDPFSFTLLAGQMYDVGAISDVGGNWYFDVQADSQNGITSIVENPNFRNFSSPMQSGHAGADGAIRLLQNDVPEPSALLLLAAGLAGFVVVSRRRAKRLTTL